MRKTLRRRIEALEQRSSPREPVLIRYGWRRPLPPDYQGERHVVLVRCEATASPWFEWCEWEERMGPAPDAHL